MTDLGTCALADLDFYHLQLDQSGGGVQANNLFDILHQSPREEELLEENRYLNDQLVYAQEELARKDDELM